VPITKPPPIPPRALPDTLPEQPIPPRPGRWVWTCRAGFEAHLYEELAWARVGPRVLGEALVESERPPKDAPPAFARLGFIAWGTIEGPLDDQAVTRAAEIVKRNASGRPLHLQAWPLDTATANPLSEQALAFRDAVTARLQGVNLLESAQLARQRNAGVLAQLCVVSATRVLVGGMPAGEALSLAPGGRMRMRRAEDAPSRASAKLDEALELMGLEPQAGDTCVDLGAAPGGWTRRLVARGARVIAVDPAKLAPDLERHKKVTHVQESAFAFAPEEPADWVFCDMAWRPLEVAQLLAKWSRRAWAQTLVANIKLPMKDKNPVLHRVKHILTEGGWKHLSVRQLYHDRDEVTVMARRN
jgi:23S rRNA (cytidine2498-2'-O)-methyltransferase